MKTLSKDKKRFIDDSFYEGQTERELSRQKFELLTEPEELHYLAEQHNWDNGVRLLQWITASDICSEATALHLFWLAKPNYYQAYKFTDNLKETYENDVFDLIKIIYKNYLTNFYRKTKIPFELSSRVDTEQQVPDFMKEKTKGEETYIYLGKNEVESWFGETLKGEIERCNAPIELFNIASFIKAPEPAKFILEHPLCDKGIAVVLFWRLKTFASIWHETEVIMSDIIKKIQSDEYQEILSYDPKKDSDIKMKETKPKWAIPESMFQIT